MTKDTKSLTPIPWYKSIMGALLLLLVLMGGVGGRPPECKWAVERPQGWGGSEGLVANCSLRTLTPAVLGASDDSNALIAPTHAPHITSLTLNCARQIVFESKFVAGMFAVLPRLEVLKILGCKVTSLPADALAGLPELHTLTIRAQHQDWPGATLSLSPQALADVGGLEQLDLAYNELWSLPKELLCRLPGLRSLNLTHNRLHHLPDLGLGEVEVGDVRSLFSCPLPMNNLDLSYNQLAEVQSRAFAAARSIQYLSLKHNRLSRLDDKAFRGLLNLKVLDLANNQLVALPRSALQDSVQLTELHLSNNSLSVLPPGAFGDLNQLHTLDISHNQLSLGASNLEPFRGLIRLVLLNLSHNYLMHLGPQSFVDLSSLQVLRLEHNQITHILDDTFQGLANLHSLNLSENKLSVISGNSLSGLAVLSFLSLDNNLLTILEDDALDNCSSLQHLTLSHNQLQQLPKAVNHTPLLRILDLSNNQINSFEGSDLEGLHHLRELDMSYNELLNVSRTVSFNLPSLTTLALSHNQIMGIEHGVIENFAPHLKILHLQHNHLPNIIGIVTNLKSLKMFNISYNHLEWIDYALVPEGLESLDVSHNRLIRLDNYYGNTNRNLKLRNLYVTHNSITEINADSIPKSIEYLYLTNNFINFIGSNTFIDKVNVSEIDLCNNNLTLIDESSLRLGVRNETDPQTSVHLSGNPLECNCGADWLLRAASLRVTERTSLLPYLKDFAMVKCTLPGLWHNARVPLISLQQQQFLCTYRRHCFTLCHCCEFDACDCEQSCPENCTCYHDHTWTTNVVACTGGWDHMPASVPMDVTEAFMDGNNMTYLTSHSLIGRKNLRVLHLNHSNIISIQNRTFNGLKTLEVLRLNHNRLEVLHGFEFLHLKKLRELYLDHNILHIVSNMTFAALHSLELLNLASNHLITFSVWNLALNPFLLEVNLLDNPWSCECKFISNFRSWLESNRIKATSVNHITCRHNLKDAKDQLVLTDTSAYCDHYVAHNRINTLISQDFVMLSIIGFVLLSLLLTALITIVMYRHRLKLWAGKQYGKNKYNKSSAIIDDCEKLFDAFISHSSKDVNWVCGLLAPELESSGYCLCVAHRDCVVPTAPLSGQTITESVNCSRSLVIVISRGFLDTEWCRFDIKTAHIEAVHNIKSENLIVVALENISKSELDPDMIKIINSAGKTLHPRDPGFWDKLRNSLPRLRRKNRTRTIKNSKNTNIIMKNSKCDDDIVIAAPHDNLLAPNYKSLTVSPYWENASMGCNLREPQWSSRNFPDLVTLSWRQNTTKWSKLQQFGPLEPTDMIPEHTYMSISEMGDATDRYDTPQPPFSNPNKFSPLLSQGDTGDTTDTLLPPSSNTHSSHPTTMTSSSEADSPHFTSSNRGPVKSHTSQLPSSDSTDGPKKPSSLPMFHRDGRGWIFHSPTSEEPSLLPEQSNFDNI
ncbi:unnamed protein product [Meganyctiphanes norvegica]|uniref:TIR domain-containing protein n=1 Tax=Meganyctiphanes norvegica TaxID=48144 RepID=A0AAV2RYH7_MEGNR